MVANIFLQTAPTLSFRLVGLIVLAAAALAAGGGIFAAVPSALPSAKKADAASPQPTSPQAAADRFGDPLPAGALARLGTVRLRHDEVISCVIVAADGNSFMAADWDGVVRLWDTSTGRLIRQLKNRDGKIFCATLSPDGKTAATGNWDGSVRLWDTSTGDVTLALKPFSKEVNALTFTPDGKRLVGTSGSLGDDSNSIAMWNVSDGQQIWRNEETTGMVESLSVSPDGALIFCLEWSRLLTARDASSGKERYHASFGAADGSRPRIANSTAVKLFAVEGGHDSIHLLAQETGKVVRRIESPAGSPMAFTPDGKRLVRVVDEFFQVWDVESGRRLRRFSAAGGVPASLAFTPDGRTLIAGGTDHRVRLYDFVDGKERPIADGHDGPVSVGFAANGTVVTAGDATVRLWNPWKSEPVRTLTGGGGPINSLAVSPDGRFAVTANSSKRDTDHPAQLWDLTARRPSQTLEGIGQGRPKIAFSPDGRTVAATGDPIHVWNVADGKERKRWQGLGGSTTEIAFSPDGQTLAAGGDVQSVTLFDPATGKPVKVLTASGLPSGASATGLSFAPDGKTITACFCGREDAPPSQDDMVRAWDIATGREIGRRPTSSGAVSAMALSADGRLLALGFPSGVVTLFETLTNTEIATYSGHTRRVVSLAFAPDGLSLASGSADTTALLWDLTGGRRTTVHSVPTHLAQDQLAENWKSLGGETRLARQALWNLVAAGDGCVPFLEKMLRPKAALNAADVRRLLTDLDSDDFNRREAALSVLENHGEAVASQLKQAAEAAPSAEVRRRIVGLLENADGRQSSPGRLRRFRAVEALEQIGTRTARRLLADLATAESESELGAAARAAGARLASRE
jgi:WD40 repeat protein